MHFSKAYAHLLSTLPPQLRKNAFEYRKLKQLINQIVTELDSLGLLHQLKNTPTSSDGVSYEHAIIAYEIAWTSSVPEPRLRWILSSIAPPDIETTYHVDLLIPDQLLARITAARLPKDEIPPQTDTDHVPDLIIPLPSDAAFFQLLTSTLSSLSDNSDALLDDFHSSLTTLAASISLTARPTSSSAPHSFSAYSPTADNVMTLRPHQGGKSDLYTWREIFSLYTELQVFESVAESTHGERSVEDVEKQLDLFKQRVQDEQLSSASRHALDTFLNLNAFILDLKKFQRANSEATRKILKKHAKRTTLPVPFHLLALAPIASNSLPRLLVQAISEVLLPIIPHIDDYSCLICACVAFKPIRLCCGHFFCVRCLVKLQKRGMPNCPLCRASTVLQANPSNIDYALLNFITDWFPIESLEKLRDNQREVAQEQLEELGIADVRGCQIM